MKEIKATNECRHEIGYKLMRPIVSWNYKRKYHPVVIGGENIPKTGPLVFCGNHRHKDDQYNVMLETKRVIHMLSKDEYFKGKSAWFYRAAGCIPVDRSIHDENAKSEARAILHSKGCIGIFPEGTRNEVTSKDEELEKLVKILNIPKEEIIEKIKYKSIRTTQVNLLIELKNQNKITKDELKEFVLDADNALLKLLKKKIIKEEEYNESLLLPFKFGAVSLAKKENALIIPFATTGLYNGEKNQLITRIGKPLDVSGMELEDANKLLRQTMIKLMQKSE
ncbi:MAG: 1-acyl-sn-glycerol-3-phosphate acyltransferase [Mollicutes bacterium]|nr:1-acyl-sn-glycerol-3-phosphate acyltransferase [Mollicutes bacterium]